MQPSAVVAVAAAAALACGKHAEEDRFDAVRATCEALVGRTLAEAEADLGWVDRLASPAAPGACSADLTAWNARDTCAYDGVTLNCEGTGWSFRATDPRLCDAAGCVFEDGVCVPVRCWYGCLIRTAAAEVAAHGEDHEIPICASRFVSGQPAPPAS